MQTVVQEVERDGWVCACLKRDRRGNMSHIKVNSAAVLRCKKCKATRTGAIAMMKEMRERKESS